MLKRFLSYVEIRTKLASVLPFLLALLYCLYAYKSFNWMNTLLFFVSMLLFDMATTALNNYMDTKTNGAPLPFARRTALWIFFVLVAGAGLAGLLLVWQSSLIVLFCGALCFGVGILYTFGPAPISRMPLGEMFSGLFMGFFIPFLTVLVNAPPESLIDYTYSNLVLQVAFNLAGLLKLILLTVPAICGIANIMLANNICDLEHDVAVSRFTLPYHIGRKNALYLFSGLYYLAFAAIFSLAVLKILPVYILIVLPVLVLVQRNIRLFYRKQSKAETFPLSVQNFVLILVPLILVMAWAAIFR